MPTNLSERWYHRNEFLNDEARAVIEAEFEEIASRRRPRPLRKIVKEGAQWIAGRD